MATRENSTPSWVKAEKVDKVVDTTGAGKRKKLLISRKKNLFFHEIESTNIFNFFR